MLSLKDVERPYTSKNNEQHFLRGINLSVETGEIFGIIGRSGAGKSALLRCISLLERPVTGIVSIDNKNLTIMVNKELRDARKMVGQVSHKLNLLSSKTVYQNIALPLILQDIAKDEIERLVDSILDVVGLRDKTSLYPSQLNQSQKIRTAIARALVAHPKILLLDDITSGLDQKSTQQITQLLSTINKNFDLTMVIITNDIELIKTICNRVGIMHQGELIEQCTIYQLFTTPKTEVAKDFIRATTRHEMPWVFRRNLRMQTSKDTHPILRIAFSGCLSPETILGEAIQTHGLRINIIQAHQETIQEQQVNVLLIEINGELEAITESLTFLKDNGLQSEILGYVSNTI